MVRKTLIHAFPALLLFSCACAHIEPLEPAGATVALAAQADSPRTCTPLGDVRGVEDEALPHAERIASTLNAMRNEAARRGATRIDRTTVELSETQDGPPHAVASGLAYRCLRTPSR